MYTRIHATINSETPLGQFTDSETLRTRLGELRDFALQSYTQESISDELGTGTRTTLIGRAQNVEKRVQVSAYGSRPRALRSHKKSAVLAH